jgi:hypothetical protein
LKKTTIKQSEPLRPVDQQFEAYDKAADTVKLRPVQYVCILLLLFALLTIAWALPFPHLGFLGRYNGYVNWASFMIAFLVYFYLKLSPMVSYAMLFLVFGCSYGIIQLEQWQKVGGPTLGSVGSALFLLAMAGLLLVYFVNSGSTKKLDAVRLMLKSPLWLIVTILRSVKVRY